MTPHTFKFVAPAQVLAAWDVSRSFLWRMEKSGLIKPVYLYSRKLYAVEDVERIEKMIANGELRAELRGAARKNADTRVHEGKTPEQGRTSDRSGGEAQQAAPEKKPKRKTETQNQPQKINEPTTK